MYIPNQKSAQDIEIELFALFHIICIELSLALV
jgi:hypothetical protein